MATNINTAFTEFLKETVNLDTTQSTIATSSKNWLIEQINNISNVHADFPTLVPAFHLHYGSFARKTKTRPLNDIDIMIGIHAFGSVHNFYNNTHATITANQEVANLKALCNAGTNQLNSIKVVNCFVRYLKTVHQYKNAEIKRSKEAAVLNLTSYDWSFDIVPCFQSTADYNGNTFYLIPDGNGDWKKTDPRIDRDKASQINQNNSGNVLNVVRIIKFWNSRRNVTTMPSYLIENLVLNFYAVNGSCGSYIDLEVIKILEYLITAIFQPVLDPKNIQGDINTLTWGEKSSISRIASTHATAATTARRYESEGNHHMCTLYWYDVFGADFPRWG